MKRLIVLLCALYLVLPFGTTSAASPNKVTTTLNDIPPAWSKTLQCDTTACPRFELVLGGAAVLDHETGLVWEQSPSNTPVVWAIAVKNCQRVVVGGRKGWHLPTIEQLLSLVDPSVTEAPLLPAGHPFTFLPPSIAYWSATTSVVGDTTAAMFITFGVGDASNMNKANNEVPAWCVRGGQIHNGY
jgi:hypothetical protein